MILDRETRWILGRPSFECVGMAEALRKDGRQIEPRAEDEQAVVLHWMLSLYEMHGDKWRDIASDEMKRMRALP